MRLTLGIELKRPGRPAVFFLRFPSAEAADEARAVLEEDGFEVEVREEPVDRLVVARRKVRPDSFDVAERALSALAAAKGGSYAGYRREA